ncbi:MAG: hypothetical protein HY335_04600 [Deinococcus sp.]|nr:hypothetical protein [Deinococcus sp.]
MLEVFSGDPFLAQRAAQAAAGAGARRLADLAAVRAALSQGTLVAQPSVLHLPDLGLGAPGRRSLLGELAAASGPFFASDGELSLSLQAELQALAPLTVLPTPKGPELLRWVQAELKGAGVSADTSAAQQLITLLGADLARIAQEIQRLSALDGSLTASRVAALVAVPAPVDTFSLLEALAREPALALVRAEALLEQGEPPLRLLATLAWHYDLLLRVQLSQLRSPLALAKRLGAHPFPVRRALALPLAVQTIAHALEQLYTVERQLKSGAEARAALVAALAGLALNAPAR